MHPTDRKWPLFLLLLIGMPAWADDDAEEGENIQGLLDSIPEIKAPAAAVEEAKPEPAEALNYDSYTALCSKRVMEKFQPPRGIIKKHPRVEFQLMVTIDAAGEFTGVSANKRSGHRSFDAAAMRALNEAGSCPQPPLGWNVATDRVILKFNARTGS